MGGQAVQDGPGRDSLTGDNSKTPLDPLHRFTTLVSRMEVTVIITTLLLFLALEAEVEAQVRTVSVFIEKVVILQVLLPQFVSYSFHSTLSQISFGSSQSSQQAAVSRPSQSSRPIFSERPTSNNPPGNFIVKNRNQQ